jgi:hypothetical protein
MAGFRSSKTVDRRRHTNGWFGKFDILSKEYERTIESSKATFTS